MIGGRKLILLIEDDQQLGIILSRLINRQNKYFLKWAENCGEAKEVFAEFEIDLVFMHLGVSIGRDNPKNYPQRKKKGGLAGIDLAYYFKSVSPDIKLVTITGSTNPELLVHYRELNCHYLIKPLFPDEVLAAIDSKFKNA